MEIIVESRRMKAGTVLDMAFDLGLDRPRISTVEEWNGAQAYILTFGPPAYRKTAILRPSMTQEQVRETLILAKAEEIPKPATTQEAPSGWTKEASSEGKTVLVVSGNATPPSVPFEVVETLKTKPQKRKAAKSRG
jgi:hypothetical protein